MIETSLFMDVEKLQSAGPSSVVDLFAFHMPHWGDS